MCKRIKAVIYCKFIKLCEISLEQVINIIIIVFKKIEILFIFEIM